MKDVSSERKPPRILLVSGIFPPDVGGPAVHVRHIAEHFTSLGWGVTVVAFGEAQTSGEPYRILRIRRSRFKPWSWALYAWRIAREASAHDLVYGFDLTTAGIPGALFARLYRKPFMLRIGGDPIWERTVEKGKRFLPMRAYYEQRLFAKDRPMLYRAIRFVVLSADRVVTYCDFLKEIYAGFYGLPVSRIELIRNPFPERRCTADEAATVTFIFAGRFVSYKNIPRVLRAFSRVAAAHPEARLLLIGDGPEEGKIRKGAELLGNAVRIMPKLSQEELFKEIGNASVALAPALTEFNPNFILESLALGKPALVSRDNGLSAPLPQVWQFDPLNDDSLAAAMERMLDPMSYAAAREQVAALPMDATWNSVVRRHEELVRQTLGLT